MRSAVNFLSEIICKLLSAGVDDNSLVHQKHRLESINGFCIICISVSIPYYFIFTRFEMPYASLVIFINHILYAATIYLNKLKKFRAANICLIIVTQSGVFSLSVMLGYNSGFYQFLYTTPFFVFWIFKMNEGKKVLLTTLSYVLILILLLYINKTTTPIYEIKDPSKTMMFQKLNLLLSVIIIFYVFYNHITYYTLLINSTIQKQLSLEIEIEKRIESESKTQQLLDDLQISYTNLKEFNYIVSHNLRAPVSNILGLLSILDTTHEKDEHNLTTLNFINLSAQKLDTIIDDLNDVLEQKNQLIEYEYIDLYSLCEEIHKELNVFLLEKNITLEYNNLKNKNLTSSRFILQNIFRNLIRNGIKFASNNSSSFIKINIEDSNGYTIFTFEDNGIGIDLNKHGNKLFKLFAKINPEIEGKGIGLYLIKNQIDRLNGQIVIESTPNVGTKFIIKLINT